MANQVPIHLSVLHMMTMMGGGGMGGVSVIVDGRINLKPQLACAYYFTILWVHHGYRLLAEVYILVGDQLLENICVM